jgi:putative transposase
VVLMGRNWKRAQPQGPAPRQFLTRQRTFAWFGRNRRLAKDFERTIASAEAWFLIASVRLLSRRLARA